DNCHCDAEPAAQASGTRPTPGPRRLLCSRSEPGSAYCPDDAPCPGIQQRPCRVDPALRQRHARRRTEHAASLPRPVPDRGAGSIVSLTVAAAVFIACLALVGVYGAP